MSALMAPVIRDKSGLSGFGGLFGNKAIPSNYEEHLRDVVNQLNHVKLFNEAGISFSHPTEIGSNNSIDKFDALETAGKVFPNVIAGFEDTLRRIQRNKGGKSYCFFLPTNCGKTTYSNMVQFFGPSIIWVLTGKRYFPIRLIPNKCSGEGQTAISYNVFRELYGEIKINFNGESLSLKSIEGRIRLDAIDNDESIMRCSVESHARIKVAINEVYGKEGHVLFISDEPTHGSNIKGVLDRILELSDDLYNEEDGDIFIGTDATPFELFNNENIELIIGTVYPEYSGITFINGIDCPGAKNNPRPSIITLKSFSQQNHFKNDLSIVYPSYYKEVRQFNNHMRDQAKRLAKGKEPPNGILIPVGTTWTKYKKMCEDAIVEFLEWVAGRAGKVGVLNRFVADNPLMDHGFIEKIRQRLDGKIQILKFFNQKLSFREFLKEHNCNQSLPYVVFVTAGCRMGEDCPVSIGYALEFCNSSTARAVIQGLYGRICGPNKGNPPAVYIGTQENVDILEEYISSKGKKFRVKASTRSETINDDSSFWNLKRGTHCAECQKMIARLDSERQQAGKKQGFGFNVVRELEEFRNHVETVHNKLIMGMNDVTTVMVKNDITGQLEAKLATLKLKNGLPFFSIYQWATLADQRSNVRHEATGKNGEVFPVIWVQKELDYQIQQVKFRLVHNKNEEVVRANAKCTFSKHNARTQGVEAAKNGKPITINPYPAGKPTFQQWNEGWTTEMAASPQQAAG
jgi:hypothetical protein